MSSHPAVGADGSPHTGDENDAAAAATGDDTAAAADDDDDGEWGTECVATRDTWGHDDGPTTAEAWWYPRVPSDWAADRTLRRPHDDAAGAGRDDGDDDDDDAGGGDDDSGALPLPRSSRTFERDAVPSACARALGPLLKRENAPPAHWWYAQLPPDLVRLCLAYVGTFRATPAELDAVLATHVSRAAGPDADPYAHADVLLTTARAVDHACDVVAAAAGAAAAVAAATPAVPALAADISSGGGGDDGALHALSELAPVLDARLPLSVAAAAGSEYGAMTWQKRHVRLHAAGGVTDPDDGGVPAPATPAPHVMWAAIVRALRPAYPLAVDTRTAATRAAAIFLSHWSYREKRAPATSHAAAGAAAAAAAAVAAASAQDVPTPPAWRAELIAHTLIGMRACGRVHVRLQDDSVLYQP